MHALDLRNNLLVFVSKDDFQKISSDRKIPLDTENLHHIRRVLRRVDEVLINVSSGDGRVIIAKLNLSNTIERVSENPYIFTRPISASLINPGIKRKNLDHLIQKSTEIGVDKIYFINSNYQNFPVESPEKYIKTAENACIQSKNLFIPLLKKHNGDILNFPFRDDVFYFWGDPSQEEGIEELSSLEIGLAKEVCFINGSEGGWSPVETEFLKNRFRSVRLSDNVLRAETAAIVALFYIKILIKKSLAGKNK